MNYSFNAKNIACVKSAQQFYGALLSLTLERGYTESQGTLLIEAVILPNVSFLEGQPHPDSAQHEGE